MLLPRSAVWVGAQYGFPHIEAAARGKVPLVSDDYGDDTDWQAFFTSICNSRPAPKWELAKEFHSYDFAQLHAYVTPAPSVTSRRNASVELPFGLGTGDRDFVQILETTLQPWSAILETEDFDVFQARAFASLLSQGRYVIANTAGASLSPLCTYVSWVKSPKMRGYERSTVKAPSWVVALRETRWVPTDGGTIVRPCDVLLQADPRNSGAQVADLDEATKVGLAPLAEALQFGSAVPRPGPLAELVRAAERPHASNETLRLLWIEVLGDEDLDVALLRERARVLDMVPVATDRRDGKSRVTASRLVKTGNADFGGFLCGLAETLLPDHAPRLAELLEVPERPTAAQALKYLEWVWTNEPPEVEEAVVAAWRAVVSDRQEWPAIRGFRTDGRMKLFCRPPGARRGEWLKLPSVSPREPVWNDAPDKASCLRPTDGLWPEAWISRRSPEIDVDAFLELSGLGRLSGSRFLLVWNRSGDDAMPDETARLQKILSAIRAIHDGDSPPPGDLVMRCAHSIERTFRVGTGVARVEQRDASWDGDRTMHVVGHKAALWASDLRPLVQEALELRANSRALRLLDLIPLLDDGPNFERKLEQMCAELDVPSDAFQPELAVPANDAATPDEMSAPDGLDQEHSADVDEDSSPTDGSALDESDEDVPPPGQTSGQHPRDSAHPSSAGGGEGEGGAKHLGGTHKRHPSGTGRPDPGIAPDRFLINPHEDDAADSDGDGEHHLPKDDVAARAAVMSYERRCGRTPTEADRYQRGFDVSSVDGTGVRKIEVKGLQGAWQGQASVSMTGAQFDDARREDGDWWLYVVENAGSERANVIPIPNPALGTRAFYLYACHWRHKAVAPPPKRLQAPDDDED